jgi:hypothetical protein
MATCGGPPRFLRRAIELHNSKLLRWELRGADLMARLDAYVHVSLGVPGEDQGTGWSQEVELLLRNVSVEEKPRELPLWIAGGTILVAGDALELLPIPFEAGARISLQLWGAEGKLAASGDALTLTALGEARFVERFEGA